MNVRLTCMVSVDGDEAVGWGTVFSRHVYRYTRSETDRCPRQLAQSFSLFIRFWTGGCKATLAGKTCLQCSDTTHFSRSTLLLILQYVRSSVLNLAWMPSTPCSPNIPTPTRHCLMKGTTWSSSMCSLGINVLPIVPR